MVAVFSIKPHYASEILSGVKKVEYRRIKCSRPIKRMLIYSSSPISSIVGEVSVDGVLVGSITTIWKSTKEYAGLSYRDYLKYYDGKDSAIAYVLKDPIEYSPSLSLSDFGISHAPQSFCYLPSSNRILPDNT